MDVPLQHAGGRTASVKVVLAVAEANGCDETELPPLYGSIDPDVLDELVAGAPGVKVHFEYAGREVTVRGDGVDGDGVDVGERA